MTGTGSFAECLVSAKTLSKLPVRYQERAPSPRAAGSGWKGDIGGDATLLRG